MKKIDWETFKKALEAADQTKKDLMSSEVIYECVVNELNKTKSQLPTKEIIILFGDYILGLRQEPEVMEELNTLGVPDVFNFFKNVLSAINQNQERSKTAPVENVTPSKDLASEIAQTEHEIASIQGIRTMPADMKTIQPTPPSGEVVYTSSQSDILHRAEDARWESEH